MKKVFCILSIIIVIAGESGSQTPALYEVSRMSFSENGFSDISPVMIRDGVLFCSDRRFSAFIDRTSFDGNRLYNLYFTSPKDSTRWQNPQLLTGERQIMFNNGPVSIAGDGKTVFFTSEIETGRKARRRKFNNHNGIFIAGLSGTELTGVRPFTYNSPDYETGHPSVSHDGKLLYFASDMPGGFGKTDIYCSELVNGQWTKPVNLGPRINSSSAEIFPYIHHSGKLYFASDRPGGKGGLDVYSTSFYNGQWDEPAILPDPINSSSDDFGLTASEDFKTGYFSSNRTASDDIYRFRSTIIRKLSCDEQELNSYCYRFTEENAVKYDTIPFLYQWNFGDGQTGEGTVVEHCYEGPGRYTVRLDVINLVTREVIYNEKTDTLVVEDVVQPYISGPDTSLPGQNIRLDASETNLPGWNIERYYWNFGDETIATGTEVIKSYSRPGTYNIQLIVTSEQAPDGTIRETCVSKNIEVISGP